jgi:conjugal transfer pilus assembly protein TraE
MEFKKFIKTWKGTQRENNAYRYLVIMLVVSNIVLAMATFVRSEVIVLTPPDLTKAIRISREQGDQGYSETWGLAIATLLGNVTPGNADFTKRALATLLSPSIYQQVLNELYRQAEQIKIDRVSIRFEPREVNYEEKTGKVFVTGYSYAVGPYEKREQTVRTYELIIRVINYQPNIVFMDTYSGDPHTLAYLEKNLRKVEQQDFSHQVAPSDDKELAEIMKKKEKQ